MATVESKDLVEKLIKNKGQYPGDPRVIAIYEYYTPEGQQVWSVCYTIRDIDNTLTSPFVKHPRLIFPIGE